MKTLDFVKKVIEPFLNDDGLVEPEVTDIRDFVAVSCWSAKQTNLIFQALLNSDHGLRYQYSIVVHPVLESRMILVAKGIGRNFS